MPVKMVLLLHQGTSQGKLGSNINESTIRGHHDVPTHPPVSAPAADMYACINKMEDQLSRHGNM